MSRILRPVLGALALLLLLTHAAHYRATWTDDAFITFRYARQFAAGEGMVFNPGERLEGITNLGLAIALAPFAEGDLLLVSQVIGLLAGVGTVIALAGWARREGLGLPATAAALATMVLAPWPAFWMVQGLETPVVMLLMTLAWSRYRAEVTAARGPLLAACAMGLAPWFRPDAALLAILIGGWHLVRAGGPRTGPRVTRSVAIVVALAVALVGVKLAWFGAVLPNTFYVKSGHVELQRGLRYLWRFLTIPSPLFPALLGLALGLGIVRAVRRDDRGLPALVFTAYGVAAVLQNGDFFANYRMFVPAWPAACAALGLAVQALLDRASARLRARTVVAATVALGVALGVALAPMARVSEVDGYALSHGDGTAPTKEAPLLAPWRSATWGMGPRAHKHFATAWALVNVGPAEVVAYSELGLLGFVHEGAVLDMLGLTDRVVAGRDGQPRSQRVDYVTGRADAIVFDTAAGLWPSWRDELAARGWSPAVSCLDDWVFVDPADPITPPDAAELDRRLGLLVERAPRAGLLLLAVARELGAVGSERTAAWLTEIEARGVVSTVDLAEVRCDTGLTPGCDARATCLHGAMRRADLAGAPPDRWPLVDPAHAALQKPAPRDAGDPPRPPPAGPPGSAGSGAGVPPDGAPPHGGPPDRGPPEGADGFGPPPTSSACMDAREAAAAAWDEVRDALPHGEDGHVPRERARIAGRDARMGGPDLLTRADEAVAAAATVRPATPELSARIEVARAHSVDATEGCP